MKMLPDMRGEIVAGYVAAGFKLGSSFSEVLSKIEPPRVFSGSSRDWIAEIGRAEGWLQYDSPDLPNTRDRVLWYGRGALCLSFSELGVLFQVLMFKGYEGKFKGNVSIGSHIDEVIQFGEVVYDNGDESYFFNNPELDGIGFGAFPPGYPEEAERTISTIFIFNWALRDTAVQ